MPKRCRGGSCSLRGMRTSLLTLAASIALVFAQDSKPAEPAPIEVGSPAPTFRLNDHEGRIVEVGGKSETWTVLAFFPKAMTPG